LAYVYTQVRKVGLAHRAQRRPHGHVDPVRTSVVVELDVNDNTLYVQISAKMRFLPEEATTLL